MSLFLFFDKPFTKLYTRQTYLPEKISYWFKDNKVDKFWCVDQIEIKSTKEELEQEIIDSVSGPILFFDFGNDRLLSVYVKNESDAFILKLKYC